MRIAEWANHLLHHPALADVAALLRPDGPATSLQSIAYEARPVFLASALASQAPRRNIIVTATYERALQWHARLVLCGLNKESVLLLPSGASSLFEDSAPEHIALSDRLGALKALTVEDLTEHLIIITTPGAALERTLPPEILREATIEIEPGQSCDVEFLIANLERLGYERQEPVRQPGTFSIRGGIVDIFPSGRTTPLRLEFFGDEVESVRMFDPNTQRSVGNAARLTLGPGRETLYHVGDEDFGDMVRDLLNREVGALEAEAATRLEEIIEQDARALSAKKYFDRIDLYRPILHPDSGCSLSFLQEGDAVYLDEPLELETIAARTEEELHDALEARQKRGEILQSYATDFILTSDSFGHLEGPRIVSFSAMNSLPDWLTPEQTIDVQAVSMEPYRGRAEHLVQTLKTYQEQGFSVSLSTDQPNRAVSVLEHAGFQTGETEGTIHIVQGNLGGGFVLPEAKVALLSDAELFGVARLKLPQKRFMEGAPVATVLDLKPGDYVVHINFGIGVFRGLVKRAEHGIEKEFLLIDYAPPDKLFVPADQLDRVQKYLNPGDETPKLNRLTGGEWQKTLGKAKEEAKEFARDLVKLYAQRKAVQRRPFGPDTPWQLEMESTFPYVETPSQMQAIRDAKHDLEVGFPMDRLVCGDVGFGKTEVAIRVAFKVAQSGRQVAVLCPTTILSEQHFRNFSERLEPFGTKLALVNRFTHTSDRHEIVAALKSGKVEIIIGTHSLLGQGIEFRDLALVVIDEEQKFGVKQKEMLKKLRTEVDILTLSATPIPRTLSMALMDIRQLSLINDPPPGRLPIRSIVRPYAGEVVREAVLREIARGGQVFYVYNRVESIQHVAERLRRLVPHARIGIGHGQMTEKELEPIMIGFIKGEIDILLSTTIIENGIDISNANTLIVENADRLGLAQLYQLRGRVGRSDRQAYAYFLYDSAKELSENAMSRLQALQEFSSLGSGYSLAFRDLQIRGAGELLGAKQHGAMATVGYELYTQLINEAVAALKNSVDAAPGETVEAPEPRETDEPLPVFDVPVPALLPESYITDMAQRLYYYQRIMSARTAKRLGEVQGEIEDRYGALPDEVRNVFAIMAVRIEAKKLGFSKMEARSGRISVSFDRREEISPRIFSILGQRNRECYLTRETLIWPYTGSPLLAGERLASEFGRAAEQVARDRASILA